MEKTKTVNTNKNTSDERVKNDTWGAGCPFWFFGNKDSADNDLKDRFVVVDDKTKD